MSDIIYANGFRISVGALEAQLVFKLESPVIDENDQITGVKQEEVADIRINIALVKQIGKILNDIIDDSESANE